jgi:hypothetical protein
MLDHEFMGTGDSAARTVCMQDCMLHDAHATLDLVT